MRFLFILCLFFSGLANSGALPVNDSHRCDDGVMNFDPTWISADNDQQNINVVESAPRRRPMHNVKLTRCVLPIVVGSLAMLPTVEAGPGAASAVAVGGGLMTIGAATATFFLTNGNFWAAVQVAEIGFTKTAEFTAVAAAVPTP